MNPMEDDSRWTVLGDQAPREPRERSAMAKVPFNCKSCGCDFQLYHDGTTHQDVTVTCYCGTQNRWEFQPALVGRYRGFGMAAASVPADLEVWSDGRADGTE